MTAAEQVAAYRACRKIEPIRRADGRLACANDLIRIWPNRGKGNPYRHDNLEVRLAAQG